MDGEAVGRHDPLPEGKARQDNGTKATKGDGGK